MHRRTFLATCVKGGGAFSLTILTANHLTSCSRSRPLIRRSLGQTGETLSILGFGGIMLNNMEQPEANNLVARVFDAGVNYYDVAPSYGNAEEHLGPALKPYRDDVFLACKTQKRDRAGAEGELNASLGNLQTDHFDLYQLHAIRTVADVEQAFGPNGAMETFRKARDDGKVRFLGFSAHSQEAALLAMEQFDFDTILFPVNFVCWHHGHFGPEAVKTASEKNMGILAIKSMAFTPIPAGQDRPYPRLWYVPIEQKETAHKAVRFTLAQGVTAAIPPGDSAFFLQALSFIDDHSPLNPPEEQDLQAIAAETPPLFSAV